MNLTTEIMICPRHGTKVVVDDGVITSISVNCKWTHNPEIDELVTLDEWYKIQKEESGG